MKLLLTALVVVAWTACVSGKPTAREQELVSGVDARPVNEEDSLYDADRRAILAKTKRAFGANSKVGIPAVYTGKSLADYNEVHDIETNKVSDSPARSTQEAKFKVSPFEENFANDSENSSKTQSMKVEKAKLKDYIEGNKLTMEYNSPETELKRLVKNKPPARRRVNRRRSSLGKRRKFSWLN
ncbi:uncharacterized protein LOC108665871 [Hyalella azteca]|uniref:Uncharacterized protein LOC108665871 n=1 Tax=Hyalella azteca TaxID=294128 RepID=A0A8B7N2T8_HYAAZ|nr:uncharacterized protein LOC108665871 [Hyalella azteca]